MGFEVSPDSGFLGFGRGGEGGPTPAAWLDGLPIAVLGVDGSGAVVFANLAAQEMFAGLSVDPGGRAFSEFAGERSPLLSLLDRVRRDGCVVEAAMKLPGVGPYVSVIAAPVGEHVALAIRRAPPTRGEEPSRTRAVRTFSHEVRNPLAGIRAAAQLIGKDANPEHAALVALICEEVDRLGRLTERFDALASDDALSLRVLNIHEPLTRVRQLIGSMAPSLRVSERYDPSLPPVRGDFDQLVQAFFNIAKNAVEVLAERRDGELTIATTYRPGVHVRTGENASARALLEVSFVDNGPGVSAEVGGRLFEAFVTTKETGMGLGLSIASTIVARHGGAIEVQSAPGRTEFKVTLPIESGATA